MGIGETDRILKDSTANLSHPVGEKGGHISKNNQKEEKMQEKCKCPEAGWLPCKECREKGVIALRWPWDRLSVPRVRDIVEYSFQKWKVLRVYTQEENKRKLCFEYPSVSECKRDNNRGGTVYGRFRLKNASETLVTVHIERMREEKE